MVDAKRISLQTKGNYDSIDITPQVEQQMVLIDFDNRPRSRQIILRIMGD